VVAFVRAHMPFGCRLGCLYRVSAGAVASRTALKIVHVHDGCSAARLSACLSGFPVDGKGSFGRSRAKARGRAVVLRTQPFRSCPTGAITKRRVFRAFPRQGARAGSLMFVVKGKAHALTLAPVFLDLGCE